MPEDLVQAQEWVAYWKGRAEEAQTENARLEGIVDDLKTRLILRQEELLALYRPSPGGR